jgi:hypothetical protein
VNEMSADDRLRALGRAARVEVEAGLDVDAELCALDGRSPIEHPAPRLPVDRSGRRSGTVWVAAAAAVAVALAGGVWLLGDDDATIQTAEPETTLPTDTTVAPAPTSTVATDTTAPPDTTAPATDPAPPGACTNIKAHDVGVDGIAGLVVEARLADQPPAVAGCLEAIPAVFDGTPGRCWSCPEQAIEQGMTGTNQSVTGDVGFTFSLFVSTPVDDDVVDTVETWWFEVDDDLLVLTDISFDQPLVSRADSLATIDEYLAAIEAGDWLAAARMLDDGAVNPDERDDLQRLELDDYSYESVAVALAEWCADGCSTERPTAADLALDGYTHSFVRFGERVSVVWYEGTLSIHGLPPRLPDRPTVDAVDWRDLTGEPAGITNSCVRASLNCTRVIHDVDGTSISYDPNTRVLTRHGVTDVAATLPESYGLWPWLYHAGPDDVVYLQVDPATPAELAADLVAVALSPDDAGREIARWDGVVDMVGDSELVATPDGLVNVNCCGPDQVRPSPDAEVLVPWVDRTGSEVVTTGASIRTTVYPDLTIARTDAVPAGTREWTFRPPDDWIGRGMPQVTPTFDGGFVAALADGQDVTVARGWPDGGVEQITLQDLFAVSLDRNGRVLIGDGDRIWRVEPFADRTVRPESCTWGCLVPDVETGTVSLPDLSAVTADWTQDPVAFADAVGGPPAVNEERSITADQRSATAWLVTITMWNFFDDSVFADRWELTLERADDGRFSFVSGRWSNVCQPNRGHQDFQPAFCV